MRASDSLPLVPPGFVVLVPSVPLPRKRQGLPGSWVVLCVHAPLSDPARPSAPGLLDASVLPSVSDRTSAPGNSGFGALSRSLHTRCLRFAAPVTRTTTQDSLPAGWPTFSGWDSNPQDHSEKFQATSCFCHVMTFPFPQASPGARPHFSPPSYCGREYSCHCALFPCNAACDVPRARPGVALVAATLTGISTPS